MANIEVCHEKYTLNWHLNTNKHAIETMILAMQYITEIVIRTKFEAIFFDLCLNDTYMQLIKISAIPNIEKIYVTQKKLFFVSFDINIIIDNATTIIAKERYI